MRLNREQLRQAMLDAHYVTKHKMRFLAAHITYSELFAEILGEEMKLHIYLAYGDHTSYGAPFRTYDEIQRGIIIQPGN